MRVLEKMRATTNPSSDYLFATSSPELVRDGSRARVFEFLLEDDGCFSTSVGLAP
jgi:hypothetical protein